MPDLRLSLMWKSAAAAVMAVVMAAAAFLIPDRASRAGAAEHVARLGLARIASELAPLKAQALAESQFDRLESRYKLPRRVGQATVSVGLCDINGEVLMAVGEAPRLAEGAGRKLFNRALQGETPDGTVNGLMVSLFPLGPSGKWERGEQALGVFVAAAPQADVLKAAGQGRGIRVWLQIAAGLAVAAGLILAFLYRVFLRPIRLIALADQGIDVEAERFPLAPEDRLPSDELGRMARARNLLVERLREERSLARQANRLLERAEAKCRSLVEDSRDVVWRCDLTGQFLYVSPSIESELGLAPQELYDSPEPFFDRTHPDDVERVRMAFAAIAQGESVPATEFRMIPRGKAGAPLWFSLTHKPILDARGHVQGVEGVLRNVTEAKNLEMELEDCRLRFDAPYALSQACRKNLSRRELLDLFARQSAEVLGMERAMVTRIAGESYRVVGLYNFPEEMARRAHLLAGTPQGKVARSGRALALLTERAWSAYGLDRPYVGTPILDRAGETIGTICCYGVTREATDDNIRAVSLIGELLSSRLEALGAPGLPVDPPEKET